jgi:hypothetical protein
MQRTSVFYCFSSVELYLTFYDSVCVCVGHNTETATEPAAAAALHFLFCTYTRLQYFSSVLCIPRLFHVASPISF